jgi:5-methylcytosine-specific restriction endonuclease McrA
MSGWHRARRRVLARDPVCVICRARPSTEVDHVVMRAAGGGHDMANLRGLCTECHRAVSRAQLDKRGPRARIVREW